MKAIVVIGGGEISKKETLPIDKHIVALTGKRSPKALFVPTASGDADGYCETFHKIYGNVLGCKTDVLLLLHNTPSYQALEKKILSSDLIYVGGGNTLAMMRRWRHLGVDKLLKKAFEQGTVMAGLSAGGICWFDYGHSDSMKFYHPQRWTYIRVKGLGLIKGIHCPHFNSDQRRKDFREFMMQHKEMGIALEDRCALEVIDGKFRIFSADGKASGYKMYRAKQGVLIKEIPKNMFLPLGDLYEKG